MQHHFPAAGTHGHTATIGSNHRHIAITPLTIATVSLQALPCSRNVDVLALVLKFFEHCLQGCGEVSDLFIKLVMIDAEGPVLLA